MSGRKNGHTIYNQVLRYTGLFGGVQGFAMLMALVRNKFAAVFLGSAGLGLIDVFNRTVSLFSAFTSIITPIAATRSLSVAVESGSREILEEEIHVIRSWTTLTALTGLAISLLLSPAISLVTFGDYGYTRSFVCIAFLIPVSVISGAELSILKATGELSKLAWVSFYGAAILAAVTIPFYVTVGMAGIVPALLTSSFLSLFVLLRYTVPLFPWRVHPFSKAVLGKGKGLIKLSISYILANIVASSTEFLIRTFMMYKGDVNDVGMYSAGLLVTVAVSKFIFVAMDADFYPRLSKCCQSPLKMNLTVNRQLEVCVLLMAPVLIACVVFMPHIIRILYSEKFQIVAPMAVFATFYMFFKAINTPVAYIPLAKGDGRTYLLMESLYYIVFLLLIVTAFYYGGIVGTGIALSCANLIEMATLSVFYHRKYRFVFSKKAIQIIAFQGVLTLAAVIISSCMDIYICYTAGGLLIICSAIYTMRVLAMRSSLGFHRRIQKNK